MRQLVLDDQRDVVWADAPEPDLGGPDEALVRPVAVALCDLDHSTITGAAPFPTPIALGHEGVAEVVAVGDAVRSVRVGDLVVVPYQPSCGRCERCQRGKTGDCRELRGVQMYGFGAAGGDWGGFLSDVVRVPWADAMLVRVPAGVDPADVASASDNMPDAWRHVAPGLAARPGADVLVLGGGCRSIALYSVGLARALGAGTVVYADDDPARLATASDLGGEPLDLSADGLPERLPPRDIVVDATASAAGLACACRSATRGGYVSSSGIVFEAQTPLPVLEMFNRGVTFHIGRAMARPAIPPILDLVAAGTFNPGRVTDRTAAWADAAEAVKIPATKLIITREYS